MKDIKTYLKDIDEMSNSLLNKDQKEIIKRTILNMKKYGEKDIDIDHMFQMFIRKVKIGFTFDEAPSVNSQSIALLKKDHKLSFENNSLSHKNTLIIGENYDVLKNLLVIERERERDFKSNYDVIYIDPPYNTEKANHEGNSFGEKENISASKFIYRDKFSRNGWLNIMNERLKMARQLLKEDGVIFVSIDDTEQAYLKVLMDEIFGEENFIATIVTQKGGGKSDSTHLSNKKEYVICFAKSINELTFSKQKSNINNYKYQDENGKYALRSFDRQGLRYSKSLDYPIIAPDGSYIYAGQDSEKWKMRQQGNYQIRDWCWTLSQNEFEHRKSMNQIVFIKKNNWKVQYKSYYENKEYPYSDLLIDFNNTNSSMEIKKIFSNRKFDYAKPINLIKHLINLHPNKNARVLDFFAGSGTTGHAVLELNKEDDGNRTFTLITNNENNIGLNICYERLYRINNGKGVKGELNFEWRKKNEPYNQNIDVFKIEYYNSNPLNTDNTIIKKAFMEELSDFQISNPINKNINELLLELNSLKPINKKDKNEIN